jgi:hypothetical protein
MIDRLLRRAVTGYLLAVVTIIAFTITLDRTGPLDADAKQEVTPRVKETTVVTVEAATPKITPLKPTLRFDDRYNQKLKLVTTWQTDDPVCKLPALHVPLSEQQAKDNYEQAYLRALMWPSDHNIKHFRDFLSKLGLCDAANDKCYVDGTSLLDYADTLAHFGKMHADKKLSYKERRTGMCQMITSETVHFLETVPRERDDPYDACFTLYEDVDRYKDSVTGDITEYAYWRDRQRKTEGTCGETEVHYAPMIYYTKVRYEGDEKTLRYWLDVNSFTTPSDPTYPQCSAQQLDDIRKALDEATDDWEAACETCGIDYQRTDVDLSEPIMIPADQYVTFIVTSEVPTAGEVAKAFFPIDTYGEGNARIRQSVELNPNYYCTTNEENPGYIAIPVEDDWTPGVSLTGILRHEFGHTLGYGHEFMADIGTFQQSFGCGQDADQDPQLAKLMDVIVAEPDRSSVMMYPCGRIERSMEEKPDTIEFEISEADKLSHQCFYTSEDPDETCRNLGVSEDEDEG